METGGGRKRSCGDQRLGHRERRIVGYRRHALTSLKENGFASSVRRMKLRMGDGAGRSARVAAVRLPCAPIALLAARCGMCSPLERLDATLEGKIPRNRRTEIKIQ